MSQALAQEHEASDEKSIFGFWVYLMTDCVVFATLFATYAVLHKNTAGGPSAFEIFELPYVLVETMLLLVSSFTTGLVMLALHKGNLRQVVLWLAATFVLGAGFLGMELFEFAHMIEEGHGPATSGFLSSYFTLVGTHGFHIFIGLLWIGILTVVLLRRGITRTTKRRTAMLSLFWHFLDIIWICIFSFVYLLGVSV